MQKGVPKYEILKSYEDDIVVSAVPNWYNVLNDYMDQKFLREVLFSKKIMMEAAIRKENFKHQIMNVVLAGDQRVTEITNWRQIFGDMIEEMNRDAIYEDTFDMS